MKNVLSENLVLKKKRGFSRNKRPDALSWIQKYQNKRRDGLGCNHKKKNKKKKYVDLPSSKICSYCGNSGHIVSNCSTNEERIKRNTYLIKQVLKEKDHLSPQKEPKQN